MPLYGLISHIMAKIWFNPGVPNPGLVGGASWPPPGGARATGHAAMAMGTHPLQNIWPYMYMFMIMAIHGYIYSQQDVINYQKCKTKSEQLQNVKANPGVPNPGLVGGGSRPPPSGARQKAMPPWPWEHLLSKTYGHTWS